MERNKTKGLQGLVAKKITDQPNAVITYLDFSLVQPEQVQAKDSLEFTQLGLSAFTRFVELSTERVTSAITKEQQQDISKLHGLDTNLMLSSVMQNEMDLAIDRKIRNTIDGLAASAATRNRTKFQTWANKWFDYEPKDYLGEMETQEFSRKLVAKILTYANKIAIKSRRGPANFIICGPQMGSMIQDHAAFDFSPLDNGAKSLRSGGVYYVGNLVNLEVYIDPYIKWSDKRVTLGRRTESLDQPGIVYITQEPITETMVTPDTMASKIVMSQRMFIGAVGTVESMFYSFQISEKPHNLFTHLIDVIKEKINKITNKK